MKMEYLSGIVERITYCNEQNGFSVIKIKSKGFSDLVTVVGNLATVNVGSVLRVKGEWKYDSKYGKQFSVVDYRETVPATITGIEKYLGSGLIKGIGPVYARKIVKHFKEDTLRVIEESADYLINVDGIGPKRVEMVKKAWQEQKEIKNVMLFLQSYGVSAAYAVKIFKAYGNESIKIVKNNPYRLADDIWGIGFKTADKIARQLGFAKNSYERCRSGIIYVLNELANEGHCFALRNQLLAEVEKVLELEESLIHSALGKMEEEKSIILEELDEKDAIYLPPFFFSETGTAKRIIEINAGQKTLSPGNIENIITGIQREFNIRYDPIQLDAIKIAAASKFVVLTDVWGKARRRLSSRIRILQKMAEGFTGAPTGRRPRKCRKPPVWRLRPYTDC